MRAEGKLYNWKILRVGRASGDQESFLLINVISFGINRIIQGLEHIFQYKTSYYAMQSSWLEVKRRTLYSYFHHLRPQINPLTLIRGLHL